MATKSVSIRALLVLLVLCLLLVSCAPIFPLEEDAVLRVVFLDVGQGDSILLQTREGNILIDAGPESAQANLCRKLRDYGVEHLKLAIFTHPDEDHIGGADGVLAQIPTDEVWFSVTDASGESYTALMDAVGIRQTRVTCVAAGDYYKLGDLLLSVLSPKADVASSSNDTSIVLKMTCGTASALFVGDAGVEVERELVASLHPDALRCDLYKVGHHGSYSSTSEELLEVIQPTWGVISCSADNTYGHPHGEILDRLREYDIQVLRTDRLGDIVFVYDGETFTYQE